MLHSKDGISYFIFPKKTSGLHLTPFFQWSTPHHDCSPKEHLGHDCCRPSCAKSFKDTVIVLFSKQTYTKSKKPPIRRRRRRPQQQQQQQQQQQRLFEKTSCLTHWTCNKKHRQKIGGFKLYSYINGGNTASCDSSGRNINCRSFPRFLHLGKGLKRNYFASSNGNIGNNNGGYFWIYTCASLDHPNGANKN